MWVREGGEGGGTAGTRPQGSITVTLFTPGFHKTKKVFEEQLPLLKLRVFDLAKINKKHCTPKIPSLLIF